MADLMLYLWVAAMSAALLLYLFKKFVLLAIAIWNDPPSLRPTSRNKAPPTPQQSRAERIQEAVDRAKENVAGVAAVGDPALCRAAEQTAAQRLRRELRKIIGD